MKWKFKNGKWRKILLASAVLLLGSGVARAQVRVGGNIYGGGERANVVGSDTVRIQGRDTDTVLGNVYGGGMVGQVSQNTVVELSGSVIGTPGAPTGATNNGIPVKPVAVGGRVFGGGEGSESDRDDGLVQGNTHVTISGDAQVLMNVYGGGDMASVGSGNLNDRTSGVATVTVSGGQVGPLDGTGQNGYVFAGGRGRNAENDTYWNYANVDSSSLVMTAGTVWGSLFGGSEDGHVIGDATVNFSGGNLGTTGKTSWDGNIFGGGRNYDGRENSSGRVGGNIHVSISGTAQMIGNVFGGGRQASVGIKWNNAHNAIVMQSGNAHGNIYVDISGGTIGSMTIDTVTSGSVVGGCMGNTTYIPGDLSSVALAHAKNTYVTIRGGRIFANVFGGAAYGTIHNNTNVSISGGEIGYVRASALTGNDTLTSGNVYGGGRGYVPNDVSTLAYHHRLYGIVMGDTYVNVDGGNVHGNLFGGGKDASTGTYTVDENTYAVTSVTHGNTYVTVKGGTVGPLLSDHMSGYVFGGGEGRGDDAANKFKYYATVNNANVMVDSAAWVCGSVFGGGAEGHIWDSVRVEVRGGRIGTTGLELGDGNVYGGGGNMTETNFTAGRVGGNVHVIVRDSAQIYNNVYGGGYAGLTGIDTIGRIYTSNLADHGNTLVEILNGTIGADREGNVKGEGRVFGGGMGSETGNRYGYVANAEVRVSGLPHIYGCVYGGGELASVGDFKEADAAYHTAHPEVAVGDLYCASGGEAVVSVRGGQIGNPITGSTMKGYVYGGGKGVLDDPSDNYKSFANVNNTTVTVAMPDATSSDTTNNRIWGCVFGGGSDGHVLGDIDLTFSSGVIGTYGKLPYEGNIFGAGRNEHGSNYSAGRVGGNVTITMTGGTVKGNVYGGGKFGRNGVDLEGDAYASNLEHHGKTTVNISGGQIGTEEMVNRYFIGNVFGSGRGSDSDNQFGYVANSEVNISDEARVLGNVYGGGELASVGDNNVTVSNEVFGLAKVTVTGGTVGMENVLQRPTAKGSVFGGGYGKVTKDNEYLDFANVDSTRVEISGSTTFIANSVYGGGENGHVMRNTDVLVNGGTIGRTLILSERVVDSRGQGKRIYTGNVYGGGSGATAIDSVNYNSTGIYAHKYSVTAGRVYGNTNVVVNAGNVRHAVYGGGNMATVGTCVIDEESGLATSYTPGTGLARVTVEGSALIGPNRNDLTKDALGNDLTASVIDTNFKYLGDNEGWIFGSSRGISGDLLKHLAFVDSTVVTVQGNAEVVSNVFGGGENGHVNKGTNVIIKGGVIGGIPLHGDTTTASQTYAIVGGEYDGITVHLAKTEGELTEDIYGIGHRIFRGNVFGGGKGTDSIGWQNPFKYCYTAGRVYGNTHITVSDNAKIYNKVFGGGTIASVGTFTYEDPSNPANHHIIGVERGGHTYVTITGGQIGTDGLNNGDVYGGGRGIAGITGSQEIDEAYVGTTHVIISDDADIRSSVYGGAANGHVQGDAHVDITGGTIGCLTGEGKVHGGWHSNVYGGGGGGARYTENGKLHLSITSGRVFGNTEVNISGDALIYHNVYGGGAIASVGTYDLTPGAVNVLAPGTGDVVVNIMGGQIGLDGYNNGHVYGSGRGEIDTIGAYLDSLSYAGHSYVNIGRDNAGTLEGTGVIKGSVYGSGENGHVFQAATVNVYKGTIGCTPSEYEDLVANGLEDRFKYRGNVYGAGCGTDTLPDGTYNPQSGIVWGDATVNIYGGYISRNVYGGGAMASVGNHDVTERHLGDTISWPVEMDFLMGGKAVVNVYGGHIGTVAASDASGDVFGGARGAVGNRYKFEHLANVREAHVNVNFTPDGTTILDNTANVIVGSVYGSGENGHVWQNTYDTITNGLIGGSVFGGGKGVDKYLDSIWIIDPDYPTDPDKHLVVNRLVHSVTAGKVYGNTHVIVNNGTILKNVYGGGNMASVGKGNYWGYGEGGSTTTDGITYVKINGGTIGTEVWDDNTDNGHVFGGSKGTTFPTNNRSPRYNYSRDFFLGYINYAEVTIGDGTNSPRVYGSVFGGAENGHVRMNTEVVVNSGSVGVEYSGDGSDITAGKWTRRGNVYGAGRGIDKIGTSDDYCQSAGSVTRNTHVTINNGTVYRDVYGGGSLATVGPPPAYLDQDPSLTTVDILGGTIGCAAGVANYYGGNVYGSSRGEIAAPGHLLDTMATVKAAVVNIGAPGNTYNPLVLASVYGSGENGHVNDNAIVNIYSGRVGDTTSAAQIINVYCGNVFGAGSGTDKYDSNGDDTPDAYNPKAGIVYGNTFVNVHGGSVMRNVYGGGEMASVGTITDSIQHIAGATVDANHIQSPFLYSWPYELVYADNTGITNINVYGGRIGITGKDGPTDETEVDNGDIYGGSKGAAGERYAMAHIANVDTTHVNINYRHDANIATPTTYKDDWSLPCIAGAVYGGGENGHVNHDTYVTLRNGLVGHAVYGGGKGKDTYKDASNNDVYDITAGKVYGNTHISVEARHIDSAYVVRSVFGGGNLASVGVGNYAGGVGDYNNNVGYGELVTDAGRWADTTGTGHTYVEITGGTLGMLNALKPNKAFKENIPYGSVFGGCRGMAVRDVLQSEVAAGLFETRPDAFTGFVNHTHVKIGEVGGDNGALHLYGSVYGGAQDGHVRWNTNVNINSGEIGVSTDQTAAMGNSNFDTIYWTARGNVFGAGSGIGTWDTIVAGQTVKKYSSVAGSVTQKVLVNINGGLIHRNVYGGGDLATVGPPRSGEHDCSNDLTGIQVNINTSVGVENAHNYGGFVYGGSRGMTNIDGQPHTFKKFALCSYAEVNIGKADGSVSPEVNSVFGGGENGQMGLDHANVENIHDTYVNLYSGAIRHSVYGGGQGVYGEAHYLSDTTSGYIMGSTHVNLYGGTVGNVFGGSRRANIMADTYVNVGMAIDSGNTVINGNVYGANNYNGSPFGDVYVNIYKTAHSGSNIYPENPPAGYDEWNAAALHANTAAGQTYAINQVFGGGNLANYLPKVSGRAYSGKTATVHIYGCTNTIREVYGGANAADIGTEDLTANTDLIIDGGRINRVFGGGNGEDNPANTYGTATTEVNGGLIDLVFGGGNKQGSVAVTDLRIEDANSCAFLVDSIFGGSNEAPITGDVVTTLVCGNAEYANVYGGANNADIIGNVTLNILGNEIGNVFGGSKGSDNKPANIKDNPATAEQEGNITLNIHGGTIHNAFGGSDVNGNVEGVITVNVLDTVTDCALDLINVYGGSSIATIAADSINGVALTSPIVNIIHGTVKGNVFGGSFGESASMISNPMVNIGYDSVTMASLISDTLYKVLRNFTTIDTVRGNVYGGGALASVEGNTTVNINRGFVGEIEYGYKASSDHSAFDTIWHKVNDGRYSGQVFGGGRGADSDKDIAKVTGQSNVNIKGGHVFYNVYGGGEMSSVTDTAFVNVIGGQVGPAPRVESGYNIPIGLNGTDGYVFGGGQGIGNDPIHDTAYYHGSYYQFANVGTTMVTIDMRSADTVNNRIWGSVFGGAEDGHVLNNANVFYLSGLTGTQGTTTYDGNIFGGGRNYSKKNYTAGRVQGNTYIEMDGGQIYSNIYGGGRLALTGIDELGNQMDGNHGNTKVVIKGGIVGNHHIVDHWTENKMGNVYGGGKGDIVGIAGHPAASALLVSLVRNTEVIIQDSIDGTTVKSRPHVYGNVFGGGEVASVGRMTWEFMGSDIGNIQLVSDGLAKVVVSGGIIGADTMRMRSDLATGTYDLKYNCDVGHVYGGSEGLVDDPANYATVNPGTAGHNNKSLLDLIASVNNTQVTISDSAWVKGSVYGGSGQGHVFGDSWVQIQGGQIGSGQMPTGVAERRFTENEFLTADSLPECVHWPYGDGAGNYNPHDPVMVAKGINPSDGKSWFGNVFGGGSGYYPYIVRNTSNTADSTVWNPEAGIVYGNSKVEITGGHILTNVYGGGEVNDVEGDSTIVLMSGGTLGVPRHLEDILAHPVTCYLFGAGKGDPRTNFNTWTNVNNVRVEVSGGWIYGSVFGGGEEGHIVNNAIVNIKGATGTNEQAIAGTATKIGTLGYSYVDGNVFGGGRGFSGEALTAGVVGGNITVNIKGGEMLGSIYGGGRLASAGTNFTSPNDIHYGQMQDGNNHGVVTVNISGGVIGNDDESIRQHKDHTYGGNVFAGAMGRVTKLDGTVNPIWPNLAKVKRTNLNISGDAVIKGSVYGGGEFGTVTDTTTLVISGGTIWRDVYGGGFGSDSTNQIGKLAVLTTTLGTPSVDTVEVTPMQWAGRVQGNTNLTVSGGWIKKSVYGGGELASVGTIDSLRVHDASHPFHVSWPVQFWYANNTGNTRINVTGGRIGITGKDYMGPWYHGTDIHGNDSLIAGTNGNPLSQDEIDDAEEDNGDIYGGSKGRAFERYKEANCANVNNTYITINYTALEVTPHNYKDNPEQGKGCITGAVYGGSESGHVNHDTHITLTKGLIGHAVYGGGKGKGKYKPAGSSTSVYSITCGKVYGNTHILVNAANNSDAYVVRSVFGGGNLGSVGIGNYAGGVGDYNQAGYGELVTDAAQWADTANSGHTYVDILGGTLGMLNKTKPDKVFKENIPYGSVFGGCRGMATPGEWDSLGFVNHTHVTIGESVGSTGPRLYGSVFGGAQDGHVRWDANTTVNSGEIGVDFGGTQTDSVANGDHNTNTIYWVARGNVYGGGSGIGTYETYTPNALNPSVNDTIQNYSHIAGAVLQKVNLTINGGTIHRNVYGGGNLATVGPPRYGEHDCGIDKTLVLVNINSEIGKNTDSGYGGYVYGGSKGRANADTTHLMYQDFAYTSYTRVNLNDGAVVRADVFGGGENGQIGTPHSDEVVHTTEVHIEDGATVSGSAFGGGKGSWGEAYCLNDTISGRVMGNTYLIVDAGGEVVGNLYGGGALGIVMDTANVTVNGGVVNNVFGAGKGHATGALVGNADVASATVVTIEDGTVNGSVYGGGENGSVGFLAPDEATPTATVNLNGGTVNQSAYGGGMLGYTDGNTYVNISGTATVNQKVFGGAYGSLDTVYVAGLRTVNMRGGTVKGSVYGGSYQANDALSFIEYDSTAFVACQDTTQACVVNISGGYAHKDVFGAGYYGKTYGSTYVFIGTNAIMNAPHHTGNNHAGNVYNAAYYGNHDVLRIANNIFAAADYGPLENSTTTFGPSSVSGRSDIYIDGQGYNTTTTTGDDYMVFEASSVYGCGTRQDGGRNGRRILIRNYGVDKVNPDTSGDDKEPYKEASRSLYSIQYADSLIVENSHINLRGQGKVNVFEGTEKYALWTIDTVVRLVNGSSLYVDEPVRNIGSLHSNYSTSDMYAAAPTYAEVNYDGLGPANRDNKIRINRGSNVTVIHLDTTSNTWYYGALRGYFHMMTDGNYNAFAYARPKHSEDVGNAVALEYNNSTDGGFVSYLSEHNIYLLNGALDSIHGIQMPYENHTPTQNRNGELYFRVWRYRAVGLSRFEIVLHAKYKPGTGYATDDKLSDNLPSGGVGTYYRIKNVDGVPSVNFGSEVRLVNAGHQSTASEKWMYFDGHNYQYNLDTISNTSQQFMTAHPTNVFGLTMIPTFNSGLGAGENHPWLICNEATSILADTLNTKWVYTNMVDQPNIRFLLTYAKGINGNFMWDPIAITMEQVGPGGDVVSEVLINVTINTSTSIEQDNHVKTYALMTHAHGYGDTQDVYSTKVVLPAYQVEGGNSVWTLDSVVWKPNTDPNANHLLSAPFDEGTLVEGEPSPNHTPTHSHVGMVMYPTRNFDNVNGWDDEPSLINHIDLAAKVTEAGGSNPITSPIYLGETNGIQPVAFNFDLHYDSDQNVGEDGNCEMGVVEVYANITNYQTPGNNTPVKFLVQVLRRGKGKGYYIDGVNGDFAYSGKYPNAAQPSLAGIFYFADPPFEPSDTVYIVNKVTANSSKALNWNGSLYDQLNIYRYNGGHHCYDGEGDKPYYTEYDSTYAAGAGLPYGGNNLAYKGVLVDVVNEMNINSAIIDGAFLQKERHGHPALNELGPVLHDTLVVDAPIFHVHNGAELTIIGGNDTYSSLRNNYNTGTNGGAVNIEPGGVVNLGEDTRVLANYVTGEHLGGGMYLADRAHLVVSDSVMINTNQQVLAADNKKNQNVYLSTYETNLSVGDRPLHSDSRIGVTKIDWNDRQYMPVVYAENAENLEYLLDGVVDRRIVFDDMERDSLLKYPLRYANGDPDYLNKLYYVRTWVDVVTSRPESFAANNIDTPEELAWAISMVNGLNGATPAPTTNFTITKDIDMSDYIWVPIGVADHKYSGTFEGNGHLVTGIHSPLSVSNKGVFGITNGATVQNLQVEASFYYGNSDTLGGVIANMNGGSLTNVEHVGYLEANNGVVGGLAGKTVTGSVIHSSFAVDTLRGNGTGVRLGGLVGVNGGDLVNSYSVVSIDTLNQAYYMGGLAVNNTGRIENCYVQLCDTIHTTTNTQFGLLAHTSSGTLQYCYVPGNYATVIPEERASYLYSGTPDGHGSYASVKDRKAIGYMYDDNKVTLDPTAVSNPYVLDTVLYTNDRHAPILWDGMLSALNTWVREQNAGSGNYTAWFRPTTETINGDLPLLGFPKNTTTATHGANNKVLRYSEMDTLLATYSGQTANLFLYGNATGVKHVPTANEHVFVNENSVLLQDPSAGNFTNTTVGVTFDNSNRKAQDYFSHELTYDWHLMSTPLSNAQIGTVYGKNDLFNSSGDYLPDTDHNYQDSPVDIIGMENSYFPNGLPMASGYNDGRVKWDFFSYFEPEYHWVNLKRNKKNHFHFESIEDEVLNRPYQLDKELGFPFRHYQVNYTELDQADNRDDDDTRVFIPGKGYMMAISQDSYLNSTGTLNRGDITIPITAVAHSDFIDVSANRGSNLLGNPYQAYLDLNVVADSNTQVNKFWVYDADVKDGVQGLYKPYTKGASINPDLPSRYLHPHQGFFVVYQPSNGPDTINMNFRYNMATTDTTAYSYFRGSIDAQPSYPLVNLYVTDEAGNADLTIVEFNRPEVGGVPKIENLRNADFRLYARFDQGDYGLLFTPENTERVPVFFKTPDNGTYTMSWNKHNGHFRTMRLIDNIAGVDYDMLTHDHYTFDATSTDYAARFYIVFSVDNEEPQGNDGEIFAYFNGHGWVVSGAGQLELVDMLGHVLYANTLDGESTLIHFGDVAAGTYLLRLVSGNTVLKTQKLVIY